MNGAKIRLSPEEKELVQNSEWILTKNIVLEKATQLLARLQEAYEQAVQSYKNSLPADFFSSSPKITRGENYEGLPYRVLDYPAVFKKEDIVAIRTMFWWGNFFSVTLHLSGHYKLQFEQKLSGAAPILAREGFYISKSHEQWDHRFTADNYVPVSLLNETAIDAAIKQHSFLKLAAHTGIADWETATATLLAQFTILIKILAD